MNPLFLLPFLTFQTWVHITHSVTPPYAVPNTHPTRLPMLHAPSPPPPPCTQSQPSIPNNVAAYVDHCSEIYHLFLTSIFIIHYSLFNTKIRTYVSRHFILFQYFKKMKNHVMLWVQNLIYLKYYDPNPLFKKIFIKNNKIFDKIYNKS